MRKVIMSSGEPRLAATIPINNNIFIDVTINALGNAKRIVSVMRPKEFL